MSVFIKFAYYVFNFFFCGSHFGFVDFKYLFLVIQKKTKRQISHFFVRHHSDRDFWVWRANNSFYVELRSLVKTSMSHLGFKVTLVRVWSGRHFWPRLSDKKNSFHSDILATCASAKNKCTLGRTNVENLSKYFGHNFELERWSSWSHFSTSVLVLIKFFFHFISV